MSNQALSDADLELLADMAPHGPRGEWFFPMDDEEAEWCERMGGLLICMNRMTPTHEGKHYKRSALGSLLLATLDHHTNQAKEDERRRIDELAVQRGYGDFWKVNDDLRTACGVSLIGSIIEPIDIPPFTEALEAATQKQGE